MTIDQKDAELALAPRPPRDVLLSVRIGKVQPFGHGAKRFRSAIEKAPQKERVFVTKLGLTGDEQQYAFHGGPDKALHQYCATHYDAWNESVPDRSHLFKPGGFGENLSAALLNESNVCIGDKFRFGPEVIAQVSEPRQPCYKLNSRFEYKKTSLEAQNTGRTGWYYRVLQPGLVREGDEIELIERINPTWSVSRVQNYLYHNMEDMKAMAEIAQLPGLGKEVVELFEKRLHQGTENMSGRLDGGVNKNAVDWKPYKLVEKSALTPKIKKFVFTVENADTEIKDPEFGEFPHVRLQFGADSEFTRAYSVVSGDMRTFELGIARDDNSRGGSKYLHDHLQVGDVLNAARGRSVASSKKDCTDVEIKQHLFIVGGIGITAFLPEIRKLDAEKAPFHIHYAARSKLDAAYLHTLPPGKTTLYAKSEGRRLKLRDVIPREDDARYSDSKIYCCGPTPLLNECRDLTASLTYPKSQLHMEEFGGAATGTGEPFEVKVTATGQVLQVPKEKSLLDILYDAGFEVESSCLAGNCGTCMIEYSKGEVIHNGVALDDEQKQTMMLSCVSRGKGRIVIDAEP